jgi:tetratricopeptide (TPR) repeat protein
MDEYSKAQTSGASAARGARWLLPVILGVMVSACATTQGPYGQSGDAAAVGNVECKSGTAKNNCVHHGAIEITEDKPVDPEIKQEFDQAVVLLKQEKYPDAIRLLKGVTGKTSKFTAPFIDLGIAYSRSKEYADAETSLKKALKINPTHPVALSELALAYRKTGKYKDAREAYEKLVQVYPDYLPGRKGLGVLCDIYIQDLNCALQQYEAYLNLQPDDKKVKIWVADVKQRM